MLSAILQITYELLLSLMRKNIKFALSLDAHLDGPGAQPQDEVQISSELLNADDLDGYEWTVDFLRSHSNIKVREVKNDPSLERDTFLFRSYQ